MSMTDSAVTQAIYQALQTLNDERPADEQIEIQSDTCLFGEGSVLDSLSLVSVIVDLEMALCDTSGKAISLTDDKAMSRDPVPFTSVSTLKAYILELLA